MAKLTPAEFRKIEETILEYEQELELGIYNTNTDLLFVVPASSSSATNKTVFKRVPGKPDDLENIFSHDIIHPGKGYIKNRTLPFIPKLIVDCGLADIFSGEVVTRLNRKGFKTSSTPPITTKTEANAETSAVTYDPKAIYFNGTTDHVRVYPYKETKEMSNVKKTAMAIKDKNVEAAKTTAKIAAGKALNRAVQEKIVPKLPMMVKGYAQSDLGKIVLANVAATALTYYAPDNKKAQAVSDAMIQAAMVDLMATVDIEGLVSEFLNSDAAERIVTLEE